MLSPISFPGAKRIMGTRLVEEKSFHLSRGFTLNVRGSAILNFHSMKDNIVSELDTPQDSRRTLNIDTPYRFRRDLEKKQIQVVPHIKRYGLVFDKWVIDVATRSSYPYGDERIGNEVDLLLEL